MKFGARPYEHANAMLLLHATEVKNRIPTEPRGNFLHHKGLVFVGEGASALPLFRHVLFGDPRIVFQCK
jgi:hypothetical protein